MICFLVTTVLKLTLTHYPRCAVYRIGSQYEQDKCMLKVIRKTPDYQRVNLAGFEYFEPINLTNYQFLLLTLSEY